LVILNLRSAAAHGATLYPRTRFVAARPRNGLWTARLEDTASGARFEARARVLVNAAGPWVESVARCSGGLPSQASVQLVKGSHIVVPRVHDGGHALILQNDDRRIVFAIPYERRFTLVGTTDVAVSRIDE